MHSGCHYFQLKNILSSKLWSMKRFRLPKSLKKKIALPGMNNGCKLRRSFVSRE